MSTRFFTNKDGNTLLKKFEGIFEHVDVKYFDALVGFLRASGYFRVQKFMDEVDEIRILVGINVDHLISEAARQGLEFNFNTEVTQSEFINEVRKDIENAKYDRTVEDGVLRFIDDIVNQKIKIKAHPSKKLHSKIYIFRPANYNEHNSGCVITGSSNMSVAGLEENFEFNVELRDFDDVEFARQTFEELWAEGVDILPQSLEDLAEKTYLSDSFTPFEIYVKFLMEYFGSGIEYDPESISDLPDGYIKLHYQVDAVNDGYQKMMKHNGFILADVVGLGKTIVASIIAKKFYFSNGYQTKTLIIFPPALERNWRDTIRDFEVPNVDYITNGSLHKIEHPEDYDLIIVDEAHKFRSDEAKMFNQLQKLCKTPRKKAGVDHSFDKKVILVTATPLNNKPDDIRNLLYLFQDAKNSTLEIVNLQKFFRPLIDKYKKLKKEKDNEKIKREVKKIYETIRTKVLEPIIVRRTRTDIRQTEEYRKDMAEQGMKFPDIKPPIPIFYQLDQKLNQLYDDTMNLLKFTDTGLKYYRYQAIRFLPADAQITFFNNQAELISNQLAGLMKNLLVKRLDSSFYAFQKSLERYRNNNKAMLKMLENGKVYIAPKLNVADYILEQNDKSEDKLEALLLDSENEVSILTFETDLFDKRFLAGIKSDQQYLDDLCNRWGKIDYDPKLETFLYQLKHKFLDDSINKNQKLVVFSESKETIDFLSKKLRQNDIQKVLTVNSENQKEKAELIRANFDANIPIAEQKDDYNIIITTEVLAEGVNLHRSNVIVNYDIPWNATKLMQRIGRVNRIGTESDYIYIYNFYPTEEADNEIALNQKAFIKLQAFHSALGEDSQIYSDKEEYDSFGLFEKVPEEERDERLIYLNFLRRLRTEDPDTYNKIRSSVPLRARTGRMDKTRKFSTLSYIKNEKRDAFYYLAKDEAPEELTFVEAARLFEAKITEKGIKLHTLHHEQVAGAVQLFKQGLQIQALEKSTAKKMGPNEKKALGILKNLSVTKFTDEYDKKLLDAGRDAIAVGRFQKLPREINRNHKKVAELKRSEYLQTVIEILKTYPILNQNEDEFISPKPVQPRKTPFEPKIIISESFSS